MRTIWNFKLEAPTGSDSIATVEMPVGAQVLCVRVQAGDPYLWALVDSTAAKEERRFAVYGTGHEVLADRVYVGTFQLQLTDIGLLTLSPRPRELVFHVFEV